MTTFADASAAPLPLRLKSGDQVELHPLDIKDVGQFEQWLCRRGDDKTLSLFASRARGLTQSLDGLTLLAWLSLRKGNSALQRDEVPGLFANLDELSGVVDILCQISAFYDKSDDVEGMLAAAKQMTETPPQ